MTKHKCDHVAFKWFPHLEVSDDLSIDYERLGSPNLVTDLKVSTVASYNILIDALLYLFIVYTIFLLQKNYSEGPLRSLTISTHLHSICSLFLHFCYGSFMR